MSSWRFEYIQYLKVLLHIYFKKIKKTHKLCGEGLKKHITMYLFANEFSNCPW